MKNDLEKALEVLKNGGTILYPTDTIWGIGCDATNAKAVAKIYRMKFRKPQKSLILLAKDFEMIQKYVQYLPEISKEIVNTFNEPLTVIYDHARNLPKNLIPDDGTIGIRIPENDFCMQLLEQFGKPITSTSANISGEPSPVSFNRISTDIKQAVDYVCTTGQNEINAPRASTIVKIKEDGQMHILRS